MAFAILEKKLGCNDLIDIIARNVHKGYMETIKEEIEMYPCEIEKALDSDCPLSYLQKEHQAKIFVYNTYDFSQVLISFPDIDRFCLWHKYSEWHTQDEILVYGVNKTVDKMVILEKFYYVNYKCENKKHRLLTEHLVEYNGEIPNAIPFQFMSKCLFDEYIHDASQIIDTSYNSSKKWKDPDQVIDWFNSVNWSAIIDFNMIHM